MTRLTVCIIFNIYWYFENNSMQLLLLKLNDSFTNNKVFAKANTTLSLISIHLMEYSLKDILSLLYPNHKLKQFFYQGLTRCSHAPSHCK